MKRAGAILAVAAAAFGMSGSVHADSATQVVAGSVTLSDGNHVAAYATRANGHAQGRFALTEASGQTVQGSVVCLGTQGIFTPNGAPGSFVPIAAVVTRSTDSRLPVGSLFGAALRVGATPHRIVFIIGGPAPYYVPNGDGTCVVNGPILFGGPVTAGTMVTY